jgi:predicted HicB family RNase H-like nuclease
MAVKNDGTDTKMVGADVDIELHRRLRVAAAKEDKTMAEYLRELLDDEVPEL